MLTWDQAGQPGESGGLTIEKVEECGLESRHLQSYTPACVG
jgi:hypothetical protein